MFLAASFFCSLSSPCIDVHLSPRKDPRGALRRNNCRSLSFEHCILRRGFVGPEVDGRELTKASVTTDVVFGAVDVVAVDNRRTWMHLKPLHEFDTRSCLCLLIFNLSCMRVLLIDVEDISMNNEKFILLSI